MMAHYWDSASFLLGCSVGFIGVTLFWAGYWVRGKINNKE